MTQGHYSWSQGMGILGDKVQKSQEFVTFLPTSLLFICKRGNASLHSAQQKYVYFANQKIKTQLFPDQLYFTTTAIS